MIARLLILLGLAGAATACGSIAPNLNAASSTQATLRTRFDSFCKTSDGEWRTDLSDCQWETCKARRADYCAVYPDDCVGGE